MLLTFARKTSCFKCHRRLELSLFREIHVWKGYLIMPAMNALSLGLDTQNLPGLYLPPTTLSSRYYRPLQIVPKETHHQYANLEVYIYQGL